jgi:hypothetical protein
LLTRFLPADPRRRWWLIGASSPVLVAGLVWLLWPAAEPAPRARQYLDFTACLLTDEHGVTGADAAPVWAGMQDASLATHAKVQFLTVEGPQTAANALPFLASLAQGRCDMVFAAGTIPVAAVDEGASRFPKVRFYVVGRVVSHDNVTVLSGSSTAQIRTAARKAVTSAVASS